MSADFLALPAIVSNVKKSAVRNCFSIDTARNQSSFEKQLSVRQWNLMMSKEKVYIVFTIKHSHNPTVPGAQNSSGIPADELL